MIDTSLNTITHGAAAGDKPIRLTSLARAMLEEARSAPCDPAECERLRRIYERTVAELGSMLPETLRTELVFFTVTFEDSSPSPSEIRVAQAELVGWLEGLLDGIAAWVLDTGMMTTGPEASANADDRPESGQYL